MLLSKFDFDAYNFDKSLFLVWPTWTWKTFTANKLLEKFKLNQSSPRDSYFIYDWLFKEYASSNMLNLRKPEDWAIAIDKYPMELCLRAKILVYDDLGSANFSDAYVSKLTSLFNIRMEKWLINIITSNLDRKKLTEIYWERITSRILFNTNVIIFDWDDIRKKTTNYFNS